MSLSYCEGVTTFLHAPFRLGIPDGDSTRTGGGAVEDRGANESSATPRPMPRKPTTPPWLCPARRGAALICWGLSPARRDEALRGALGVGGLGVGGLVGRVGRGCLCV